MVITDRIKPAFLYRSCEILFINTQKITSAASSVEWKRDRKNVFPKYLSTIAIITEIRRAAALRSLAAGPQSLAVTGALTLRRKSNTE